MTESHTQRDRLLELLQRRGMMRSVEIRKAGITAATISRLVADGQVIRLSRGLYQLPHAAGHAQHTLAQASKRVPRGVVCLVSALAFHGLTDRMPRRVWMAIGSKDWKTTIDYPPIRIVRFSEPYLSADVGEYDIEGVRVRVYGVAKTLADCFRHRRTVGQQVAVEGVREALRQRKASPGEIAQAATTGGVWNTMRPYVEALTEDG